jgi:excisionase family DNA binding protein
MIEAELLTVKECATLLSLSPRTIYVWIRQNRVPYYKFGKVVRFKRRDIFRIICRI